MERGTVMRVDVKLGFLCNNNCSFCVQAHKRSWGDKTTNQIKQELRSSLGKGVESVVFTGGEPSIRNDILELISFAKDLGFKTIQLQTNGRRFYYRDFCKQMIEAGMNEFSPALHGHSALIHDSLTRSKGSFKQTVWGIKNIKSFGIPILTNTVVTLQNYRYLSKIAKLLVNLGVDQYQFAFVHPIGNAWKNFDEIVPSISEAAPYIHKGLQIGIDAGIRVMAEAMPYCMMQGYEQYVAETQIPKTKIMDAGYVVEDYDKIRRQVCKSKFPQCRSCKFDVMCEGPWKEYAEKMGSKEFKSIK
jgi:MoaA/NifB/PqqE/SkfB family radical SAM enzyme